MTCSTREGWRNGKPKLGEPHIMVLCINRGHLEHVVEAFSFMPAFFLYGIPALAGYRFDRIIVFRPVFEMMSRTELERWDSYTRSLITHLNVDGSIHHV